MYRSSHRTSWRVAVLLTVAVVASAANPALGSDGVATLGSPPPVGGDAATPAPAVEPMDAMLDFAACMRDHGIDMPDPQAGGDGAFVMELQGPAVDSAEPGSPPGDLGDIFGAEFLAAEEACSHHLGAMTSGGGPGLDAEIMEGLLAHAACMRDHGIDMPDPEMSNGGFMIGSPDGDGIDIFSEDYLAAEEACREVMPFADLSVAGATP